MWDYFYARHSFVRGELDQALRLYERAMLVRPEDYQSPLLVGQIYGDLGRPQDARAARERGVRNAEEHLKLNPDDARAVYMAANGLVALGQRLGASIRCLGTSRRPSSAWRKRPETACCRRAGSSTTATWIPCAPTRVFGACSGCWSKDHGKAQRGHESERGFLSLFPGPLRSDTLANPSGHTVGI
jgi:tetratricopeptide (TPR) repeat protein